MSTAIQQTFNRSRVLLPYVDAYLVASAIETEEYSAILVPERTTLLSQKIHAY
jgi:hypothetical protein